jgi:hypothetical protein
MHAGRDLKRHPHSPEAVPHHQTDPMAKCMVVERTQSRGTTQRNNVHIDVTSLHPLVSQCDFRMIDNAPAPKVQQDMGMPGAGIPDL